MGKLKNINPLLIIIFPIMLIPLIIIFMSRPWLILRDLIDHDKIMGISLWNKKYREHLKNN